MPEIDKRPSFFQSIVVGTINHEDKSALSQHVVMPDIAHHMAPTNLPNCEGPGRDVNDK